MAFMNEYVKRGKDFVLDDMRDDFLARLFLLSVEELARIFLPVLLRYTGECSILQVRRTYGMIRV